VFILFFSLGIGKYVTQPIVRGFLGDFLVVILLYSLMRSFWNISVSTCAISVLVFSFAVEISQYFNIVEVLGLGDNGLAKIVIGTCFDWFDLLAYTLAAILVSNNFIKN